MQYDFQKNDVMTIKKLAQLLNLSVSTVSRVLNGKSEKYRISLSTSQKIIETAKKYNYSPNRIARSLKTSKTNTIGLIIPDISNPFFADIALSIEKELRMRDYSLILCDSGDNYYTETDLIKLLNSHKVEGIIIAPTGTAHKHILDEFNSGLPLIVIDRYFPEIDLPYITSDNFQGGVDAVNYLISMGHKRIACIQGIPQSQPNRERIDGYKEALIQNNIEIDESIIVGNEFSIENGYRQTQILINLDNTPTAIFALSNTICLGVLKAIKEMELIIPDDISLVSFDEQIYSEYLWIPLTTVSQKKNEIGRLAVEVLFQYIGNKVPREKIFNIKLKTDLIPRISVKRID